MASKVKTKVGDVFQIPIDDERVGFGQVVFQPEKNVLFIVVFATTTPPNATPNPHDIIRSDILLAGNTFDAKLWHGDWPIVGNVTSNLHEIALPNFKWGMGDATIIETLDRSRHRCAANEKEQSLPLRTYTAPVGFEMALKAIAGIGEWLPGYDDLKYEVLKRSSEVVV